MSFDINEVAALLAIEEKTRNYPAFSNIHKAAAAKLKEIHDAHPEGAAVEGEEEFDEEDE